MIRTKEIINNIFNRDFADYLFMNKKNWRFKFFVLPYIVFFLLSGVGVVLLVKMQKGQMLLFICLFSFVTIWLGILFHKRKKQLINKGLTATKLSERILFYNYRDARRKNIFTGNRCDLKLIEEYLSLYFQDIQTYKNRFVHKATFTIMLIGVLGYFLKDYLSEVIIGTCKSFTHNKFLFIVMFIYLLFVAISIIAFAYYLGINIYYRKYEKSIRIHAKLFDLKIALIKKYSK